MQALENLAHLLPFSRFNHHFALHPPIRFVYLFTYFCLLLNLFFLFSEVLRLQQDEAHYVRAQQWYIGTEEELLAFPYLISGTKEEIIS